MYRFDFLLIQFAKWFARVGITDLRLGEFLPYVTRTYHPRETNEGMFWDLDIAYNSDFECNFEVQGINSNIGRNTYWHPLLTAISDYFFTKPIEIKVKLRKLHGQVTFNIAPPPTDRIWYSTKCPNFT